MTREAKVGWSALDDHTVKTFSCVRLLMHVMLTSASNVSKKNHLKFTLLTLIVLYKRNQYQQHCCFLNSAI